MYWQLSRTLSIGRFAGCSFVHVGHEDVYLASKVQYSAEGGETLVSEALTAKSWIPQLIASLGNATTRASKDHKDLHCAIDVQARTPLGVRKIFLPLSAPCLVVPMPPTPHGSQC